MTSALDGLSHRFIRKINNRESLVAIVGLGYVGLPLIMGFDRVGFPTLGVDIDEHKTSSLLLLIRRIINIDYIHKITQIERERGMVVTKLTLHQRKHASSAGIISL